VQVHYDGLETPEEAAVVYQLYAQQRNWAPTLVDAQPWWVTEQLEPEMWARAHAAARAAAAR
jgi:hypothetical protein